MNCPACQTYNPSDARFCLNCGAELRITCPNCQAELPPAAHYCLRCGHPVSPATPLDENRLATLAAATPKDLAARVRASTQLAGERRVVTALFIDVADSTGLKKKLGAAAWGELLTESFNRFSGIVYRYEGSIARIQNDTLLAFFGAPLAHEDDPIRAVYAALDIREEAKQVADEARAKYAIEPGIRIGLSTGPVLVGNIRPDLKFDYTPVGSLLNRASRIQTLVGSGGIAVSEETYEYIAPSVEASEFCLANIEGQAEPLCIYQLQRVVADAGLARGLSGLESRLVGREHEMSILQEVADTVRAGMGRTALILGEAGVGKTRLVNDWLAALNRNTQGKTLQWYRARGQSYGQRNAYHLLNELVYAILRLPASATVGETEEALKKLTGQLFTEPAEVYTPLAQMLELGSKQASQRRENDPNPKARQSQYLTALKKLLRALSTQTPTALILEDLHRADPTSLELLGRLLPMTAISPLMFCLVTRPERDTPGWRLATTARESLGERLTEIQLQPLSEQESRQMMAGLLHAAAIPENLNELILNRSEGNPLFIEETVRMLISQGVLVSSGNNWRVTQNRSNLSLPASLQGLLMARIDRLPAETRDTLRIASVIGRRFPLALLEELLGGDTLAEQIATLETAGLIRLSAVHPELSYSFRHALVHEHIYDSLLAEDRARLHQMVGEALEGQGDGASADLAPGLAAHFQAAGDADRAAHYYAQAGRAALAAFANLEAEQNFRTALTFCNSVQHRSEMHQLLGEALFQQNRFTAAIEAWLEGIELYKQLGDQDRMARLYARAARAAWHSGDTPRSLKLCKQGLKAVDTSAESAGLAALLHEAARAHYFSGLNELTEDYARRALKMAKKTGDINTQADTLATLGLLRDRNPSEAIATLNQAVELAEANNLKITAARAHTNLGTTLIRLRGDLRGARKHYWRASEIAHESGLYMEELFARLSIADVSFNMGELRFVEAELSSLEQLLEAVPERELAELWLNIFEAQLSILRGEWGRAIPLLRSYGEQANRKGDLSNLGDIQHFLGWALLEEILWKTTEESGEALETLTNALNLYRRSRKKLVNLLCMLAVVHTTRGETEQAGRHLDEARRLTKKHPTPQDESWVAWAQAFIDTRQKNWDKALKNHQAAVSAVIPVGMRWQWARILRDWAETLILRGEPDDIDQAQSLLRQSQALFFELGAAEYAHRVETRLREVTLETLAQAAAHHKVTRELAMAGRVQESFRPLMPELPSGWQIAATLKPARQTSGDFYDFIALQGGRIGILIGDVADKGMGAALFMTLSRTLVRTYAASHPQRPEAVFASVNRRMLQDSSVGLFVTAFYGVLDPATGTLIYVNAGHNPPYVYRPAANTPAEELARTGVPLGLFEESRWQPVTLQLDYGDLLVLYTDGLTEAENEGKFYGEARLLDTIKRASKQGGEVSAQELVNAVLRDVQEFLGDTPRFDDLALVVVRRQTGSSAG